jgi:hypothetical protein
MVRFSVLTLAVSWFSWYEALSIAWPRYFFPPALLGSIFVAAMLYEWTNKFSLAYTVDRAASLLKTARVEPSSLAALSSIILITMFVGRTLTTLYDAYVFNSDSSVTDTVSFLNTKTSPNSLIETYESELFVFLKRRYHYPPDQVHVDLIRRRFLRERVQIDYDPLAANPDYLVVGAESKLWHFYDPYLKSGAFRLLQKNSRYEIFKRVR